MIVRVSHEGQYRIDDALHDELNTIDNRVVHAVEAHDEETFRKVLGELCDLVISKGTPVADEELASSDLVIPARDTSLEEAHDLFAGEGLIPG
jgi:hypothetical protein